MSHYLTLHSSVLKCTWITHCPLLLKLHYDSCQTGHCCPIISSVAHLYHILSISGKVHFYEFLHTSMVHCSLCVTALYNVHLLYNVHCTYCTTSHCTHFNSLSETLRKATLTQSLSARRRYPCTPHYTHCIQCKHISSHRYKIHTHVHIVLFSRSYACNLYSM